jgi:sulfate transport system ATP-binding protein
VSVQGKDLVKRFGKQSEVAAVEKVSFSAPHGRVTALLGPSGSGKSTVLRMVAGLETPDSGSILIDEKDTTLVPVRERRVGFVFQSYALFGHMTVADNIAFGLSVRKRPKKECLERAEELLSLVQLEGYGKRFPSELSGGQRQRVALARALAPDPRVLLLDEPFGALDARVRQELREWLHELHDKTKVTTLLVTHDQEEAFELADHVVLLQAGVVAQAGAPAELYDKPANAFVAAFLGGAREVSKSLVKDSEEPQARAFVRPHDVRLTKLDADGAGEAIATGKIERLVRVGGFVKLSLTLDDGDLLSVQMSKTELDELGIEVGERVRVEVKETKLFVNDYSI